MSLPDTRTSLILRIRDAADFDAWSDFAMIYWPVIVRLARRRGLQAADAEDLAQKVMMSIARNVDRWTPDRKRAGFSTWLRKVADNAILNALTRQVSDRASGGDDAAEFLEKNIRWSEADSQLLRTEYRREVFRQITDQIRHEFSAETWQSFWLTAVDGLDVDTVAVRLRRTRGSVYASRSRVMKRFRDKVGQLDADGLSLRQSDQCGAEERP